MHGDRFIAPLALLAVAALGLGFVELATIVATARVAERTSVLMVLLGMVYVGTGIVALARRPENRLGALLVLTGLAFYISGLIAIPSRPLVAVGLVLQTLPLALTLHMLGSLPSGRIVNRVAGWAVAVAYVDCLLGNAFIYLYPPGPPSVFTQLRIADAPAVYAFWERAAGYVFLAVTAVLAAVLLWRTRTATERQRRQFGLLYVVAAVASLGVALIPNVIRPLTGMGWEASSFGQATMLALLPLALAAVVIRGGFATTGGVAQLARSLGTAERGAPDIERALAGALGDPTVRLVVWLPSEHVYVDAAGAPLVPGRGRGRGVVEVTRDGVRVGAIEYDADLIASGELVRDAADVIALALERERLLAELRASGAALRRSRERVVEASDRERRRIARDLHDGVQARLVMLAIRARSSSNGLQSEIDGTIDELRELVQGVMPAALIERDLVAALEDLADRMPVPVDLVLRPGGDSVPSAVESTLYFVVAEAFANAIKHAGATRLRVELGRVGGWLRVVVEDDGLGGAHAGSGYGLRGLADRVETLAGTFVVESPPGGPTRLVAEVPCAS